MLNKAYKFKGISWHFELVMLPNSWLKIGRAHV